MRIFKNRIIFTIYSIKPTLSRADCLDGCCFVLVTLIDLDGLPLFFFSWGGFSFTLFSGSANPPEFVLSVCELGGSTDLAGLPRFFCNLGSDKISSSLTQLEGFIRMSGTKFSCF